MHTHSLSIHPDPGRALRPWELALLLAVAVCGAAALAAVRGVREVWACSRPGSCGCT